MEEGKSTGIQPELFLPEYRPMSVTSSENSSRLRDFKLGCFQLNYCNTLAYIDLAKMNLLKSLWHVH